MIILTSRNTSTKTLKERHRNIKKFVSLLNKISIANNTYLLCPLLKSKWFQLVRSFLKTSFINFKETFVKRLI